MKKIVVLGAGLVGHAIAVDLSKNHKVTAIDINQAALERLAGWPAIRTIKADLSKGEAIRQMAKEFDLVIGAVPGHMGFQTLKNVILAGKNIVDISFFPEDPFLLDALAKKHKVTAIVDCGVAPGLGNLILGYHNAKMHVENFRCLVGGLPLRREWPWEYKAVFSPMDVIEEYIRPARYIQHGGLVTREALSDPELVEFDQVGTLEAWNSDGLRTLLSTMRIPNMIEKTLRYPGTIEYLRLLRECGFFSCDEVEVNGKKMRPVDLTARLLFKQWELKAGEEDFTIMRILITGMEKGETKQFQYDLYDTFDRNTGTISMARTTGYTCTAVATLMLESGYYRPGICPPEFIGEDQGNFDFILTYLREREVNLQIKS